MNRPPEINSYETYVWWVENTGAGREYSQRLPAPPLSIVEEYNDILLNCLLKYL